MIVKPYRVNRQFHIHVIYVVTDIQPNLNQYSVLLLLFVCLFLCFLLVFVLVFVVVIFLLRLIYC